MTERLFATIEYQDQKIEALEKALTWQPIETAPKDGTRVLVRIEGGWIEAYYSNEWEPISLSSHGCGCCAGSNEPPTHWMPLPASPDSVEGVS